MNLHIRAAAVDSVFRRRVEVKLYEIVRDPIEPDLRSSVGIGLQCAPFLRQDAASLVLVAISICQLHIHDSIVEVDLWWIWIPDRAGTGNGDWGLFGRLRQE